jgi:hypothetical protein
MSIVEALRAIRNVFGPSNTKMTFKFPKKMADTLREIAKKENTSVSSIVKLAVANYIVEYYRVRGSEVVVLEPLDYPQEDNVKQADKKYI